jgi:hypothetical protein
VFDGLFPDEHQTHINDMLFVLAHWHGLAKLHMHTESTLAELEMTTGILGQQLRSFKDEICPAYKTKETQKEREKRIRQSTRKGKAGTVNTGRKWKTFNMNTYKIHALGDYVDHIRQFGSTNGFSTQLVCPSCYSPMGVWQMTMHQGEARHRVKKRQYAKTSKHRFEMQIAKQTDVAEKIAAIDEKVSAALGESSAVSVAIAHLQELNAELDKKYVIGNESRDFMDIGDFLQKYEGDPALRVSISASAFWYITHLHLSELSDYA